MSSRLPLPLLEGVLLLALALLAGLPASAEMRAALLAADGEIVVPSGPQADAAPGDFVLQNRLATAVVLGITPERRIPPGLPMQRGDLIDFQISLLRHDALVAYRPGWEGPGSAVAAVYTSATTHEGLPGEPARARLVGRLFAVAGGELLDVAVEHVFALRPDTGVLELTSRVQNHGPEPFTFSPADSLYAAGLPPVATGERALAMFETRRPRYALSVMPSGGNLRVEADARATPWTVLRFPPLAAPVELAPGESFEWTRRLTVKTSSGLLFSAWAGEHAEFLSGLALTVRDRDGRRLPGVPMRIEGEAIRLHEESDLTGGLALRLPSGSYTVYAEPAGCPSVSAEAELFEKRIWRDEIVLPAPSVADFTVVERRRPAPTRVRVWGRRGTPDPDLSRQSELAAEGNLAWSADGRFPLHLPPGHYRAVFSRGPEYDLVEKDFELTPGARRQERIRLSRVVDTGGWIAACLAAQTRSSGTSLVSAPERLLSLAAEGIDLVVSGERERLRDFAPEVERLGLEGFLQTAVGVELSHPFGHALLAWPLTRPDPLSATLELPLVDEGDPYQAAAELGEGSGAQVLHLSPSLAALAVERRLLPGGAGRAGEGALLTGLLPAGGEPPSASLARQLGGILAGAGGAFGSREEDAGAPRCYLPGDDRDLSKLDAAALAAALLRGQAIVSNGPFIAARLDPLGAKRGQDTPRFRLEVVVRCPEWIEIDTVHVVEEGRDGRTWSFAREEHAEMFRRRSGEAFSTKLEFEAASPPRLVVLVSGPEAGMARGTFPWDRHRPAAVRWLGP